MLSDPFRDLITESEQVQHTGPISNLPSLFGVRATATRGFAYHAIEEIQIFNRRHPPLSRDRAR